MRAEYVVAVVAGFAAGLLIRDVLRDLVWKFIILNETPEDVWRTIAVVDRLLRWYPQSPPHPIMARLRAQVALLERRASR